MASLAGPKRPQDRIEIGNVKNTFIDLFSKPVAENGFNQPADKLGQTYTTSAGTKVKNGDILIAAITSCTNTSNPSVLLLAVGPAGQEGRRSRPDRAQAHQDLAGPGSRVVTEYLTKTGLLPYLESWASTWPPTAAHLHRQRRRPDPGPERGHHRQRPGLRRRAVGQSQLRGPHPPEHQGQLPGLAPPLVVAYALAGTITRDLMAEPVGQGKHGDVWLGDIWPSTEEIDALLKFALDPKAFQANYSQVKSNPGELWEHIKGVTGDTYNWPDSTYIAEPPFFQDFGTTPGATPTVQGARARWACSATRSPPTTSRRPAPSKPRPPASGSKNTA